jgi:secondary thiamine-phosphate synthase enzyme
MTAALHQILTELTVETSGEGFVDATDAIADWLRAEGAGDGLLTALLRHTSASLVIQENADPDVLADLRDALRRFAPQGAGYRHDAEGPDDMPAHIRSALTSPSLSIPVRGGRMQLGTWQAVYVAEHRASAHRRRLALHFIGTLSG